MSSLTLKLLFLWSLLPIAVILTVYRVIGWKWRLRPGRLLSLGIGLLAISFAMYLYLDVEIAAKKLTLQDSTLTLPPNFKEFTLSLIASSEKLQKLYEFLSIPIAVSLIGAALLAKADASLQDEVARFQDRSERLRSQEAQLSTSVLELLAMIDTGARGQPLLDKANRVRELRGAYTDSHLDLLDDFEHLFSASVVKRPRKWSDPSKPPR